MMDELPCAMFAKGPASTRRSRPRPGPDRGTADDRRGASNHRAELCSVVWEEEEEGGIDLRSV